jgi:phosphoglycolate phosphatase-like HAD superfamily hydrolase
VTAVAVDLDRALCDTRGLWLDWLRSAAPVLGFDPGELPENRAEAGAELDRRGAGNWRALLARWGEERAPVYIRREAGTSEALRGLEAAGYAIGVFTDAPESLARVALTHLGADRRISALEAGAAARERLLERLGDDAIVVENRRALLALAAAA